jgi:FkbM family methyltransferase
MTSTLPAIADLTHRPCWTPQEIPRDQVVIYGAGNRGQQVCAVLRENGFPIACFVDREPQGSCCGVPVRGTADMVLREIAANGATAVVAVFNPLVDVLPIARFLREIGFRRVVSFVELAQLISVNDAYWLAPADAMLPSAEEAAWLMDRVEDDASRRVIHEAVAFRATGSFELLRAPSLADQYFPTGVPLNTNRVRFIDGGAYDGDTLSSLVAAGWSFESVAAFEPDPRNFLQLSGRASDDRITPDVSLWPCGLGSGVCQVRFNAGAGSGSAIGEHGDSVVQLVSVDQSLPRFQPTYVKLDIEGAEADALRGMSRTLALDRPALAVCVYHRPKDLWELPRLVDDLLPHSRFYLRSHAWNGFELVLYAVPNERCSS